jgi:L-fucose isomerase-like protein
MLDPAALYDILAAYAPGLEALGGQRHTGARPGAPVQSLYFVITGGTEQEILRLHAKHRPSSPDEPVLLLAHPGHNALPAALEVLAHLQQEGARGRILYLDGPQDEEGYARVAAALHDRAVWRGLQTARIGRVGPPSDWLVASAPDPATMRAAWGPKVVPVEMGAVEAAIRAIPREAVTGPAQDLARQAEETREPAPAALQDAVRGYHLRSHFESGLGVGLQGALSAGPVTLLRVGGRGLDRLWVAEGRLLGAGDAEDLCRTQAEIRLTAGGHVAGLLRAPLGNHLVLVPGHHRARLGSWWETMRR